MPSCCADLKGLCLQTEDWAPQNNQGSKESPFQYIQDQLRFYCLARTINWLSRVVKSSRQTHGINWKIKCQKVSKQKLLILKTLVDNFLPHLHNSSHQTQPHLILFNIKSQGKQTHWLAWWSCCTIFSSGALSKKKSTRIKEGTSSMSGGGGGGLFKFSWWLLSVP